MTNFMRDFSDKNWLNQSARDQLTHAAKLREARAKVGGRFGYESYPETHYVNAENTDVRKTFRRFNNQVCEAF